MYKIIVTASLSTTGMVEKITCYSQKIILSLDVTFFWQIIFNHKQILRQMTEFLCAEFFEKLTVFPQ